MALTKMTANVENIKNLDSRPNAVNGLTADALKAEFDKGAAAIKEYLNETLTEEIDSLFEKADNDAVPNTRTDNDAVPNTRTVNGKALDEDITLGAGDIGVVTPSIPDGGHDKKKRYRRCDTVQKFINEFLNSDLGKLIFLQADVPETADEIVGCDDESLCFPRMPDEGEYVVGKNGYIGHAELDEYEEYYDIVSTGWRLFDFGDATKKYVNEQVAAGKQYTDNQVKYGYIDKTRDFASQGTYDDVQEYLMSLGEGRWMFNSSFEQHTEDMLEACLVECVAFDSLKFWTVQEFLDDFSRSIRLYNNLSDDDTPVCVLEFYGDVGEEIGSFRPFPVATPTEDKHATTKKYVDAKFAALDYVDKSDEWSQYTGTLDLIAWLQSLGDGMFIVTEEDGSCTRIETTTVNRNAVSRVEEQGDDYYEVTLYVGGNKVMDARDGSIGISLKTPVSTNAPRSGSHVANKEYVDNQIAALDYIDKTDEYNAKITAEGVEAANLWLRTLTDGKYKVSNADEGALTLCDNFALSAVTRSVTGRFCISRFYQYSGTVAIAIYFDGDELFRISGDSGNTLLEGTIQDQIYERVPYCNTAGKVLTAKGDGSTEWTTPSGSVTLPEFTAADAGKVLKIDSDGTLYWGIDNTSSLIDGGSSGVVI